MITLVRANSHCVLILLTGTNFSRFFAPRLYNPGFRSRFRIYNTPFSDLPGRGGRVALREKMSRLSSTGGEAEVSPHANLSLEAGKRWLERREELNDRHAAHRTSHVTHTCKRARITPNTGRGAER